MSWVFRLELMCLLDGLYIFVDRLAEGLAVRLPGWAGDELRGVALHLPLAVSDVRRPVGRTAWATDATPSSGGSVHADVPATLGRFLYRRCECKGERARLDWTGQAAAVPSTLNPPSDLVHDVVRSLPWAARSSYVFRETSHVNLQEMRAVNDELKRAVAQGDSCPRRQLVFSDSRVVVGAASKGGSSSLRLNGILRSMLPYACASGISLHYLWVATDENPADGPSRGKPFRYRSGVPLPGWVRALR